MKKPLPAVVESLLARGAQTLSRVTPVCFLLLLLLMAAGTNAILTLPSSGATALRHTTESEFPAVTKKQSGQEQAGLPGAFTLVATFNGIDGAVPAVVPAPDPIIAVGPANLLLVSNVDMELRDKTGALSASTYLYAFFDSVRQPNEFLVDPFTVFDPRSNRFFVVASGQVNDPNCTPGNCVCHYMLAVSKSAIPGSLSTNDWYFYALDRTQEANTPVANFGDFDHLTIAKDVVVISCNMYTFNGAQPRGVRIRVLDKSKLIQGQPLNTWTDFSAIRDPTTGQVIFDRILPALQYEDAATPFLVSPTPPCGIVIWGIRNAGSAPELISRTLASPNCQGTIGGPDAAQPGSGVRLDITGIGFNILPVYRGGSLWVALPIRKNFGSGDVTAIRWMQIDVSDWPNTVRLVQDGVLGADGVWNFDPALVVDSSNNFAFVFARSSANEMASIYYSGRLNTDPTNTLRPAALLKAGTAALSLIEFGRGRFGDYFGAALDPNNGSVWMFGEYPKATNAWGTWVGNIAFCNYSLSGASESFTAAGGTASVTLTASTGCNWTAFSNVDWITVIAGSPGNGNGVVGYSVSPNASSNPRAGTISIAGQTFTINQGVDPILVKPFIGSVAFNGAKSLTIRGSRFGNAPRVLINDGDRSDFVISASDSDIALKGKPKKLGLKAGDNTIQVIDSTGAASNVFTLIL